MSTYIISTNAQRAAQLMADVMDDEDFDAAVDAEAELDEDGEDGGARDGGARAGCGWTWTCACRWQWTMDPLMRDLTSPDPLPFSSGAPRTRTQSRPACRPWAPSSLRSPNMSILTLNLLLVPSLLALPGTPPEPAVLRPRLAASCRMRLQSGGGLLAASAMDAPEATRAPAGRGGAVSGGTASAGDLTLSIIKSLIGTGVFSLSAQLIGGPGMVPAAGAMLFAGAASAWTFYLLGRAAADEGCTDNKQLWQKTAGSGRSSALYDILVALMSIGGLVQFTGTMVQLLSSPIAAIGSVSQPAAAALAPYSMRLLVVAACMLPLSLARDLRALRHASALGGTLSRPPLPSA